MSNNEDKDEAAEISDSQGPATLQSKASTAEKEDYELTTTKKLDKERQVIVVKPSDVEYKESSLTEYTPTEEQDIDKGEQLVTAAKAKAKEAGQSFTEMIKTLGKKTMTKLEEKTKELKDKSIETTNIDTQSDARDIQALGIHADNIVLLYERIMLEIEREDYKSQERLLAGYKKLLEEQINVIDSKQSIAKRLKDISK